MADGVVLETYYSHLTSIKFCGLKASVLEDKYKAMYEAVTAPIIDMRTFINTCDIWSSFMKKYFNLAFNVVQKMIEGHPILIQCGGPEYRVDGIISSLMQIIVDPYYRNMAGFCSLIDKDWAVFG